MVGQLLCTCVATVECLVVKERGGVFEKGPACGLSLCACVAALECLVHHIEKIYLLSNVPTDSWFEHSCFVIFMWAQNLICTRTPVHRPHVLQRERTAVFAPQARRAARTTSQGRNADFQFLFFAFFFLNVCLHFINDLRRENSSIWKQLRLYRRTKRKEDVDRSPSALETSWKYFSRLCASCCRCVF